MHRYTQLCHFTASIRQSEKMLMKGVVRKLGENTCRLQKDLPIPTVPHGHALVKNEFCGINFIDVYHRDGLYPVPDGAVLGVEAGGTVVECNDASKANWMQRRVVYFGMGGFAEYSSVPVSRLISMPDDISFQVGLGLTTMGLTAHYLCTSTAKLKPSDYVLVHAAGSGTGRLIAQVARNVFGANVFGTCSTRKIPNVPLPKANIIDYSGFPGDLTTRLRNLTPNNRGFDVVFDGVGKDTASCSLDVCRARGLVVFFGNASGPVPSINPLDLTSRGSLFITRPRLHDYVTSREELDERSSDVFEWLRSGKIDVSLDKEFESLEQISAALDYVRSGQGTGKVVVRVA